MSTYVRTGPGALARDAWYSTETIQARATKDVDLAVYVFSNNQYDELIAYLTNEYKFAQIENAPFRLKTPFAFTIDLIPFGIESIDEKVEFEEGWDRPAYINGFKEIAQKATVEAVDKETGLQFKVASLPAIVLLKLIAYDDRPENRPQDPGDIREIIQYFFDIEDTVIYKNHNDLFEQDLPLHEYAAIVIGREIKDILDLNERLRDRLLAILSLEHRTQQRMIEAMANTETSEAQAKRWIKLILRGIQE